MICPFCNVETHYLYTITKFKENFDIYQCKICKLQIKLNKDDLKNYYNQDYYEGKSEYSYIDERKYLPYFEFVWKARLNTISQYKPPPARLLDIGCSFGGFVKSAIGKGYDAYGIDISEYAISYCQNNPLLNNRTFLSDLERYQPEHKYDIITMIEVLEHLPEPDKIFKKLHELLNPGGLLIIQTANFDGLQAKLQKQNYHYYLPGHLFYYSKSNLTDFLKKNGFNEFIYFHGVDFGVIPKIKKMKGFFSRKSDYLKIFRVISYHYLSKIYFNHISLTSSLVIYAFRN